MKTNISDTATMRNRLRGVKGENNLSKYSYDPMAQMKPDRITFSNTFRNQGKRNARFSFGGFRVTFVSSNCSKWMGRFKLQVMNMTVFTHDPFFLLFFIPNIRSRITLTDPMDSHKIKPSFRWKVEGIRKIMVKVVRDIPIWIKYIRIKKIFSLMLMASNCSLAT